MGIASTAQRAVSNAAAAGCHGVATRFRDAQPPAPSAHDLQRMSSRLTIEVQHLQFICKAAAWQVCDADFVGAGANSTRFIELNSVCPKLFLHGQVAIGLVLSTLSRRDPSSYAILPAVRLMSQTRGSRTVV